MLASLALLFEPRKKIGLMRLSARSRASRCRRTHQVSGARYVGATHTPEQQAGQATEVAYDSPDRPDSYVGPVKVVIIEGKDGLLQACCLTVVMLIADACSDDHAWP